MKVFGYSQSRLGFLCCGLIGLASAAAADPDAHVSVADRNSYDLLHSVPRAELRDLNPDRPSLTDGPLTIDAGHLQLEMDFANYTFDRNSRNGGDQRTASWAFAPFNVRVGLLPDFEVQLIATPFNRVSTQDLATGIITHQQGFGDTIIRAKFNFWGNDGAKTALAFLTFLKLPTSQDELGNHSVEGGFSVPFTVNLPEQFQLGLMTKWSCHADDADAGFHSEFEQSVILSHRLWGELAGYTEFYTRVSTEHGSKWVGITGFGLTYTLSANVQLDTGVNVGVTAAAPNYNPWAGISWRF
jgi:hypothetical protein